MKRFLAVYLPTFAVDRVRLQARATGGSVKKPGVSSLEFLVLIDVVRGAQLVAQCSPEAAQCGVRRGMSLAHAQALMGTREPVVERFDPVGNQEKLEQLSAWAARFSPHVCPYPPDGLLLDVSGSERLFGSEAQLLERVLAAFEARAYRARACVASTIGCAWAQARFGTRACARVPAGAEAEALAPLSILALRVDRDVVDALAEVGIEQIAQLYALPRETLPARFGQDLLLRLDQALGRAFEPLVPLRPRVFPRADRSFESPVGLEVVAYTLRILLRELIGELEERGESARVVEFELHCSESETVYGEVVLSRPQTDFEHIWSLIEPRLERVQLGFGVEAIVLSMPRTAATAEHQVAAWGTSGTRSGTRSGPDRALAELLDTLVSRLGRESLLGVEAVESHLPEHAFRTLPCSEAWERNGRTGGDRGATSRITTLPRPSRLFTPPERVEVQSELQDGIGRPARFQWRGGGHVVVRRFGPERIGAPWWRGAGTPGVRDYFCVEDQAGRWFWLVLDLQGHWFLHGEWL